MSRLIGVLLFVVCLWLVFEVVLPGRRRGAPRPLGKEEEYRRALTKDDVDALAECDRKHATRPSFNLLTFAIDHGRLRCMQYLLNHRPVFEEGLLERIFTSDYPHMQEIVEAYQRQFPDTAETDLKQKLYSLVSRHPEDAAKLRETLLKHLPPTTFQGYSVEHVRPTPVQGRRFPSLEEARRVARVTWLVWEILLDHGASPTSVLDAYFAEDLEIEASRLDRGWARSGTSMALMDTFERINDRMDYLLSLGATLEAGEGHVLSRIESFEPCTPREQVFKSAMLERLFRLKSQSSIIDSLYFCPQ